ncbi:replication initiator protein [Microviridae sp.]|nr:replication initiator protein [Microviridae sp.]
MICLNSFQVTNHGVSIPVPCGKCAPCRLNQRQEKAGKILLESKSHEASTFVTLTYNPEHLPDDECISSLEMHNLIERMRRKTKRKIRYALCGEYGEFNTKRPHYHMVLFGWNPFEAEWLLDQVWTEKGFIEVSPLTPDRASYIARYTLKKIESYKTGGRADGRTEEFYRASTKMGYEQIKPMAKWLWHRKIVEVPYLLRFDGKKFPLARRMREHIENEIVAIGGYRLSPIEKQENRRKRLMESYETYEERFIDIQKKIERASRVSSKIKEQKATRAI